MTRILTTRRTVLLSLSALGLTGACGRDSPNSLEPKGGYPNPTADGRELIPVVEEMSIEPTPGGVIVTATGRTLPGYWDVALVAPAGPRAVETEIRLEFRVRPPVNPVPAGAQPVHRVSVGRFISNAELAGVSSIAVSGATNSRSSRR
ncbi:hypothetical protein [Mangrovicoccus algicola]|uniref:Lipoprotein n=1 Tax=Mangrovicoccus algicola TaxID=2771008 RepID=A0A8J6YU54_9RHOB|nr:hypothetical protein [Mangrovicoccus algicola]MBE3637832.1 hypothetical protein [Mangrovicoccus algicola]